MLHCGECFGTVEVALFHQRPPKLRPRLRVGPVCGELLKEQILCSTVLLEIVEETRKPPPRRPECPCVVEFDGEAILLGRLLEPVPLFEEDAADVMPGRGPLVDFASKDGVVALLQKSKWEVAVKLICGGEGGRGGLRQHLFLSCRRKPIKHAPYCLITAKIPFNTVRPYAHRRRGFCFVRRISLQRQPRPPGTPRVSRAMQI